MPTLRQDTGTYYIQRTLPPLGRVYKSLRTDRKRVADRREKALTAAHEMGHLGVVRAFDEGDVTIEEVTEAYDTGSLAELEERARRSEETTTGALEAALRDKAPDVTDKTLRGYRTSLALFAEFVGGETPVHEALTTDRIQQFKQYRRAEDEAAKETVNNDLTAISVLATYAQRKGWLTTRPTFNTYDRVTRIEYLESPEISAYMAELRPAFRPQQQLLIGTGMRLGETEELRVTDLQFGSDNRANVRDAKSASGVRHVYIPEWVVDTLRDHLERTGRSGTDDVFAIPRSTVQWEHRQARAAIGRPDYRLHDHRHTAAVHLARNGMPLHLLQRQLGHSSIDQTMKYASYHPGYSDFSKYFDRVADSLSGPQPDPEAEAEVST